MAHKKKKRELFSFNNAIILLVILMLFVLLKTIFIPAETISLLKEIKVDLAQEAEIVLDKLTDGLEEISLLSSNELIEEKFETLDKMGYDEVKDMLGIENEFCIFLEDVTGNLVKIDDLNLAIGSDKIYINGIPCK